MGTTRLSTKGQVIIPKDVRDSRDWRPGMELLVEETEEGILLRPAGRFPRASLNEVAGCLRRSGKKRTMASMHGAIEREVMRRRDRGRY